MVGETRDLETAQIAIQASLTGHLVFTTLHTNDAPGAVARLIDMGVEPFLISSTLDAVLGQRLLRSICSDCRTAYEPNESLLAAARTFHRTRSASDNFYYGKGCEQCNHTGYKGRKGIYELMKISDPIRELDQRARAFRRLEAKGDRARDDDPAAGRHSQHFRRRNDDRRSAEVHLKEELPADAGLT